jgi:hypothetical protein
MSPSKVPIPDNHTPKKKVKQFAKLDESTSSLPNYMGVDIQNGKHLFRLPNTSYVSQTEYVFAKQVNLFAKQVQTE